MPPNLVELRKSRSDQPCWQRLPDHVRSRQRSYAELRIQNPASPGVELLGSIREAARSADPEDAIEFIYTELDSRFLKGLFDDVDELLEALDPRKESLTVLHLLAVTSITSAAKDRLRNRAAFVQRVREHLAKVEAGRVEELLAGLE
jgi:hypothetical protein